MALFGMWNPEGKWIPRFIPDSQLRKAIILKALTVFSISTIVALVVTLLLVFLPV